MMNKDIVKVASAAIILVVELIVFNYFVEFCGSAAYRHMPDFSGQLAKENYRLQRLTSDIVILGSSRGNNHYVTNILRDSIFAYTGNNYSIYNAALAGTTVTANSCVAESIIDRYNPKLIIFEITPGELAPSEKETADLLFMAPLYGSNPFVREYTNQLGWQERAKMKCSFYRYNGKVLRIISSFFKKGDPSGYEALSGEMTKSEHDRLAAEQNNEGTRDEEISAKSMAHFKNVLELCRLKDIPIILSTSPRLFSTGDTHILQKISIEYGIPYIDSMDTDYFNEHFELFRDSGHLNNNGATQYTKIFIEKLKPYLYLLD